jgi:hypothetical protein
MTVSLELILRGVTERLSPIWMTALRNSPEIDSRYQVVSGIAV